MFSKTAIKTREKKITFVFFKRSPISIPVQVMGLFARQKIYRLSGINKF
jgi:hypothetical protein